MLFAIRDWIPPQAADIEAFLAQEGDRVLVGREGGAIVGWVGLRLHPGDSMGEIYILAVDPAAQRRGVARILFGGGGLVLAIAGSFFMGEAEPARLIAFYWLPAILSVGAGLALSGAKREAAQVYRDRL